MLKRNKFQSVFYAVRPSILERDENRCVKCGLTLELEVHHIEGYANNQPENLVTLCCFCHGIAPMGRQEFDQWMVFGKDGVDSIKEHLAKNGLRNIKREQVIIFCATLVELEFNTTKGRMRIARERMKASGIRCEGRLPYGSNIGESEILVEMVKMRTLGRSPKQIAEALNASGIPTRMGKSPWIGATISRILSRQK